MDAMLLFEVLYSAWRLKSEGLSSAQLVAARHIEGPLMPKGTPGLIASWGKCGIGRMAMNHKNRLTILSLIATATGWFFAAVFGLGIVAAHCIDAVTGGLIPGKPFVLINQVMLIYGIPIVCSAVGLSIGGFLLPRKTAVGRWIAIVGIASLMATTAAYLVRGPALLSPVLAPVGIPGTLPWHASRFFANYSAPTMGVLIEGFFCWLAFRVVLLPAGPDDEEAHR